jgi:hypothetical protein
MPKKDIEVLVLFIAPIYHVFSTNNYLAMITRFFVKLQNYKPLKGNANFILNIKFESINVGI